jgi:hypothetical protein
MHIFLDITEVSLGLNFISEIPVILPKVSLFIMFDFEVLYAYIRTMGEIFLSSLVISNPCNPPCK